MQRLFAWLQNFRRVLVRYERHLEMYLGFVQLECIVIPLRNYFRDGFYFPFVHSLTSNHFDRMFLTILRQLLIPPISGGHKKRQAINNLTAWLRSH